MCSMLLYINIYILFLMLKIYFSKLPLISIVNCNGTLHTYKNRYKINLKDNKNFILLFFNNYIYIYIYL